MFRDVAADVGDDVPAEPSMKKQKTDVRIQAGDCSAVIHTHMSSSCVCTEVGG